MPKPVIGIIGGIGSGKSLVAEEFVKHGGYLISGDKLGHEALHQPDVKNRVLERWGQEVFQDGEVNRKKLGAIVFRDPAELRALESLVFPWIERRMKEEIAKGQVKEKARFIVVDAAVMLEAGWNRNCDKLVYVDAPRDIRLARLSSRRSWTEQELDNREKAQWPLDKKKAAADFVMDNSGSPEQLRPQIEKIVNALN